MGRGKSKLGVPATIDGKTNPEYQRLYREEQVRVFGKWRRHHPEYEAVTSSVRRVEIGERVWKTFLKSGEEAALAEPVVKEEQ